jgi:hypothetical protein
MPIRAFLPGKSFDPETLIILNAAFEGACAELGVTETTPRSRENLAKMVLEAADGQRDPNLIREAVIAKLKERR